MMLRAIMVAAALSAAFYWKLPPQTARHVGVQSPLEFVCSFRSSDGENKTLWYRGQHIIGRDRNMYSSIQQIPGTPGFVLIDDTGSLFRWKDPKSHPTLDVGIERIIDKAGVGAFGIDQTGTKLALLRAGLQVIDVRTGKNLFSIGQSEIEKQIGRRFEGTTQVDGVTWSADGHQIAFGMPDGRYSGGSDGSRPSFTIRVDLLSREAKFVAPGVPVAWIDRNTLLCKQDRFDDVKVRGVVAVVSGGVVFGKSWHRDVGWSGAHIVFLDEGRVSCYRRDLKTEVGSISLPEMQPHKGVYASIACQLLQSKE